MPEKRWPHIEDEAAFITQARERYTYAMSVDHEDREAAADDARFHAGDQWDAESKAYRSDKAHPRPMIVENRLPTFTAQISNDGRRSKPAIKCTPMDGGTPEVADWYQGRIRQIEYDSDADAAYDCAREQAIISGRGFYRVTTRWKQGTFDQEIRIDRIPNQFSVIWDPASTEYDLSDAEFMFVTSVLQKSDFKRKYGTDAELVRSNFYEDSQNPVPEWVGIGQNHDGVMIAEYWLKHWRKRTLCLLASGEIVWKDELAEELADAVVAERECDECEVWQYIIDGCQIHSATRWVVPYIPIIPHWGREEMVDGKRVTSSLIRQAKAPQRMVNYYLSAIAEVTGDAPKSPYLVEEGQIQGHEDEWAEIQTTRKPYVQYKRVDDATGRSLAPPSRITQEPPIQALVVGYQQSIDAIKACMGIYDASLGNRSNETSGIAIERRDEQANAATYHFHANEAASRKLLGRILLELIPIIDRGTREVPIRSEDGKTTMARINTPEPYRDPETGKMVQYLIGQGKYGVAISTGPSYTSKREQAFEAYAKIAQADSTFMQRCGDILFSVWDAPGADKIAERYQKSLPPELQDQKPGEQQQIPPQFATQMQALMQQHEQLTAALNKANDAAAAKREELESRERIAAMSEETKRTIALAQIESQEARVLLEQQIAAVQAKLDILERSQRASAHEQQTATEAEPATVLQQ